MIARMALLNIGRLLSQLRGFYMTVDKELARIDTTCSSGCEHCCQHPIYVLPLEGLLVELFLEKLPADDFAVIKKQWEDWVATCESLNLFLQRSRGSELFLDIMNARNSTYFLHKVKCPFLLSSRCIIYTVRPLICRTFFSRQSPVLCRNGHVEPESTALHLKSAAELLRFHKEIFPSNDVFLSLLPGNLNNLFS